MNELAVSLFPVPTTAQSRQIEPGALKLSRTGGEVPTCVFLTSLHEGFAHL